MEIPWRGDQQVPSSEAYVFSASRHCELRCAWPCVYIINVQTSGIAVLTLDIQQDAEVWSSTELIDSYYRRIIASRLPRTIMAHCCECGLINIALCRRSADRNNWSEHKSGERVGGCMGRRTKNNAERLNLGGSMVSGRGGVGTAFVAPTHSALSKRASM